jgi:hypothetical protein
MAVKMIDQVSRLLTSPKMAHGVGSKDKDADSFIL